MLAEHSSKPTPRRTCPSGTSRLAEPPRPRPPPESLGRSLMPAEHSSKTAHRRILLFGILQIDEARSICIKTAGSAKRHGLWRIAGVRIGVVDNDVTSGSQRRQVG